MKSRKIKLNQKLIWSQKQKWFQIFPNTDGPLYDGYDHMKICIVTGNPIIYDVACKALFRIL